MPDPHSDAWSKQTKRGDAGRYHPDAGDRYVVPGDSRLATYDGFYPNFLPLDGIRIENYTNEMMEAAQSLERFNQTVSEVNHVNLLTEYLAVYEASHSSKIEGIQEDVKDFYYHRFQPENTAVKRYIDALNQAQVDFDSGNLGWNELMGVHKILMQDSEDYLDDDWIETDPGEPRDNYMLVGDANEVQFREEGEYYIAPPPEDIPEYFDNFLDHFNNEPIHSAIVDSLILHAQFGLIHGFADGNGRTARILTATHLKGHGLYPTSTFGWSRILEREKEQYFNKLYDISHGNAWNDWIKFGLTSITKASNLASELVGDGEDTLEEDRFRIKSELRSSKYVERVFEHFAENPISSVTDISEALEINKTTVKNRINDFRELGLLEEGKKETPTSAGRPKQYFEYSNFLNIFTTN